MKLLCFLFVFSLLAAQPKPADPVEKTLILLKQSSWAELCKAFAPNIDLAIMEDGNTYTKEQATAKTNAFFAKNEPFTVKLIHRVDSNPDYKFAVFVLTGKTGSYRTSCSVRNNNGLLQINELHIEMEKIK
ncbi:DUF4783 domain-containing protein [Mucilaginibacter paludis]|uniref:DUF4783 domain-containing protein n=1 Tax=Mucilaginibacter paludis DSM 18603 TaxID=714943 RepID=H1Y7M9_9SPHI|nr:DUF4783 domain-containing protein [Mucilaginibacter paludis]EHQ29874.1 hypothetical protein Mucpa_5807 [Mucilaginibacter paludis DSM 18603]